MTTLDDFGAAVGLLAVDPGLGARVRGTPGPMRDLLFSALRDALPRGAAWRKLPAGCTDDRLLGGLDLAATLATGRPVAERGLLAQADGGFVLVAMAERLDAGIAARLGAVLDRGEVNIERDGFSLCTRCRVGVIALDEGVDGEAPPRGLVDRLAIEIALDGMAGEIEPPDAEAVEAARARLGNVAVPDAAVTALVTTALALGVPGLRATLLALRAARAAAALAGRDEVAEADLVLAARLVLAPRATQVPIPPEQPDEPPAPEPDAQDQAERRDPQEGPMADRVLDAARAVLPADLLASLVNGAVRRGKTAGSSGARQRAAVRGRPIGARAGLPRGGARLHLLATLRAAAPWQRLRGAAPGKVAVRRDDFRIRRFRQQTRTTTIFVVDASGSAAVQRLAEAKGAVELLLAECYIRRDRVALLSVRGNGAELLLPPTPSLARAKKCLAALPGGGGTPLAAGFAAALALAGAVQRDGQTPLAVFLTDGRANIALDGRQGRAVAETDALTVAALWRAAGHTALLVDTANRPHPFARKLADAAAARYLPLPQVDAGKLRAAVMGART